MSAVYAFTRVITFFGAYLRAFWEHVACRLCKIGVEDIRAFRNGEMCGHIEHEMAKKLSHSFLICWLPFTMNFFLGCMFLLTGSYKLIYIGDTGSVINYAALWLGVSCLTNCAPSYEDAIVMKDNFVSCDNFTQKMFTAPFFGVFYAMSFIERFGLTLLLAIGFSILFPYIFGYTFPLIHAVFVVPDAV